MFELTRENAWNILTEHTKSESLRKHALAVEAAVRGYARRFGEDEEVWGVVALLHDFDYEQYPDLEGPSVSGRRDSAGARVSRVRHSRHPLARRAHEHAARIETRAHAVRLRRDGGLRHRRRARAAVEERPGSRGLLRHEANQGQGICERASAATTCGKAPRSSACRSTSTSRT